MSPKMDGGGDGDGDDGDDGGDGDDGDGDGGDGDLLSSEEAKGLCVCDDSVCVCVHDD